MQLKGGTIKKSAPGGGPASGGGGPSDASRALHVEFVAERDGYFERVARGMRYELSTPDGKTFEGEASALGTIAKENLKPGACRLTLKQIADTPPACYPPAKVGPAQSEPDVHTIGPIASADLGKPISGLETGVLNRVLVAPEVIPILFVPGVMGSRLKRARSDSSPGEKVWDPDDAGFMGAHYLLRGAKGKQKALLWNRNREIDVSNLHALEDDGDHHRDRANEMRSRYRIEGRGLEQVFLERGWGGVAWGFYGDVIAALHLRDVALGWGEPLATLHRLPVYACGYNWTDTNRAAGQRIAGRISAIKRRHQDRGERCDKVILLTHSMGGIAARSACMLEGATGDVLGIVHGVQPVNGAPAAYWRMKGGFEKAPEGDHWTMRWVLGKNQAEVTALMPHMPGALELLPNGAYTTNDGNRAWLQRRHLDGTVRGLPAADPYEEIYKKEREPYRLVTKRFLMPDGNDDDAEIAWEVFKGRVDAAKALHAELGSRCHAETHFFYGTGGRRTADRVLFTNRRWTPSHRSTRYGEPVEQPPPVGLEIGSHGGYEIIALEGDMPVHMELHQPDGAGDGTVPESSGNALTPAPRSGGAGPPGRAFAGIDHSGAYATGAGDGHGGTHGFVFRSIEKLCGFKLGKAG